MDPDRLCLKGPDRTAGFDHIYVSFRQNRLTDAGKYHKIPAKPVPFVHNSMHGPAPHRQAAESPAAEPMPSAFHAAASISHILQRGPFDTHALRGGILHVQYLPEKAAQGLPQVPPGGWLEMHLRRSRARQSGQSHARKPDPRRYQQYLCRFKDSAHTPESDQISLQPLRI